MPTPHAYHKPRHMYIIGIPEVIESVSSLEEEEGVNIREWADATAHRLESSRSARGARSGSSESCWCCEHDSMASSAQGNRAQTTETTVKSPK